MEIGDERIDRLEAVARIDIQIRETFLRRKDAGLMASRFEGSDNGCPDRNDATAFAAGLIECLRRLTRDLIGLREHRMVFHRFGANRPECAPSHMQDNPEDLNTALLN